MVNTWADLLNRAGLGMEVMHERNAHNFPLDLAAAEITPVALNCSSYWLISMIKPLTAASLVGAFLLSACTPKSEVKSSSVEDADDKRRTHVCRWVC